MKIKPNYEIGDTVYHVEISRDQTMIPCPDCMGEKTWKAVLPSGEELEIACPTCKIGYDGSTGKIGEYNLDAHIETLTIGSVRTDTHTRPEQRISYMCTETGVGNGTVWYEPRLYSSRDKAEAALPGLLKEEQISADEAQARSISKSSSNSPGSMTAYYRKQIRRAEKDIEAARRGLNRETQKA